MIKYIIFIIFCILLIVNILNIKKKYKINIPKNTYYTHESYDIPKNIYYTHESYKNLKIFSKQINHSKKFNPNYKFFFYDAKKRDQFIKNDFPEFYKYFKRINSDYGAAKADIFRVLILYKYGGIYIDCKSKLNNMNELFYKFKNKDFFTASFKREDSVAQFINNIFKSPYSNWFLATKKKGIIITKIKNEMLNRLRNYDKLKITKSQKILDFFFNVGTIKNSMFSVFYFTGPKLLSYILKNVDKNLYIDIGNLDKKYAIFNSNISLLKKLMFHNNDFIKTYHFSKQNFLKPPTD